MRIRLAAAAVFLLSLFALPALARGLYFAEEMRGFGEWNREIRAIHFDLDITIRDIDAWRANPNHAATVSGRLQLDQSTPVAITGQLNILAPAPGADGRVLVYRVAGNGLRFVGAKLVRNDGGFDLIDDVTTLHGVLLAPGAPEPTIADLVYGAKWTAEVQFEWWRPSIVLAFIDSFATIDTPWYERWWVKVLFVETTFGAVASEFFLGLL
ncbi:hypothetical protein [Tahibacter amnicola]|uniref:Uncharacterized protein n=1 Tax=Tahibacter amnicola TaxID=2976241 RepID=A0ABY6BLG5_9GAMM|nr:hypothetical protein [Tahibacter amnicola]UXI69416.1 hypothetical protein N4264_07140 [Tahibacter amnicola]